MAEIPDVLDYGAQPSLRSNRVDTPGAGEAAVGDALARATSNLATVYQQKVAADDERAFSAAKSEMLKEDIRLRRELSEDQDWESYDERYRRGMDAARERIYGSIRTISDRNRFNAESDVMIERGSTAMREIGRKHEISQSVAELGEALDGMRADVVDPVTDPATRNAIMLTAMDRIQSLERDGILTPVESKKMREEWIANVATGTLEMMPAEQRIAALEASIESGVQPDEIREGAEGSGSIADFLHMDTRQRMLRTAQNENKEERQRVEGYRVMDEAIAMHPEDPEKQLQHVRENTEGTIREFAVRELEQRISTDAAMRQARSNELGQNWTEHITGGGSFGDIPQADLNEMSAPMVAALRKHSEEMGENDGFGEFTDVSYEAAWNGMSPAERIDVPLSSAEWMQNLTRDRWNQMLGEQKILRDQAASTGRPPAPEFGMTNTQMVDSILIGREYYPQTGRTDAQNVIRQGFLDEFDRRIQERQDTGGPDGEPLNRRLNNDEKREIINEMLAPGGFHDTDYIMSDYDPDEYLPYMVMTPEQREQGRLPRARYTSIVKVGYIPGQSLTVGQIMDQFIRDEKLSNVSERRREHAAFAIQNELPYDEVIMRLKGEIP